MCAVALGPYGPNARSEQYLVPSMARIFIVEDSDSLREATEVYLKNDGHEVVGFARAEGVIEAVRHDAPHLCILDIMLPGRSGLLLGQEIRQYSSVPFIFLTARDDEQSRLTGFSFGADDYVTKPYSMKELVMRVRAILRRTGEDHRTDGINEATRITCSESGHTLHVDFSAQTAALDGKQVDLTRTEWGIVDVLCRNPGAIVNRGELFRAVFGYNETTESRSLDTHFRNLRKKLGGAPWFRTVRGRGYQVVGDETGQ